MNRDEAASTLRRAAACLLLALLALPAQADEAPPEAGEGLRVEIGVAPFEWVGPAAAEGADVATLLADRLATRGAHRTVGPAALGGAAIAEPSPEQVQAWASAAGVSTVAVGRATRMGERTSIDVRLRAGDSGGLIGTYVAEATRPEELATALDALAGQLMTASAGWLTADVSAAPGASRAARKRGSALGSRGDPFGLDGFDGDQPLSIRSDELEASQSGGARRLVFSKHVRVEQADLQLESGRLEAWYPENANQPERLVASGGVRVLQGTREARCDRATYHRAGELLVCEGNAELRDGDDRVAGSVIEFDLAAERVVVKGGAAVLFHPEPETPGEPAKKAAHADGNGNVEPAAGGAQP